MAVIDIGNLASEVMQELQKYQTQVSADVAACVNDVAKTCLEELKRTAPKKTGRYRAGFTKKVTKKTADVVEATVYNKDRYTLTHLLENGHKVYRRNGVGRAPAHSHIRPVEEHAEQLLEDKIRSKL